jgi:S-adenosylmethionine:tRNA ribosyltransferase-isomerase
LVVSQVKPLPALPAELRADLPVELRGRRRDGVRLMVIDRVARTIDHADFARLGSVLRAGDLLVVNRSRTIPAAVPARRDGGELVQLRICVRHDDEWHVLAVQPDPPHANVALHTGERLLVDGIETIVRGRRADLPLLWRIDAPRDGLEHVLRIGEPVRYSYVPAPVPASHYQTVFATEPGSAETPSAGRSFSWELLFALRRSGIQLSDILLHTGLSSLQDDDVDAEHPLFEEWFAVDACAADAVNRAPRVIAVGTTVVRALESAAAGTGQVEAMQGWTRLRLGPGSSLQVVDGLLTGFHEPQASHFDLLRAFLDETLLERAYREAIAARYLWHEFGDLCLIL